MIKRILIAFLLLVVLGLVFAWIVRGGPSALARTIRDFLTFDGTSGERASISFFKLPWQMNFPTVSIGEDGSVFGLPGYSERAALNSDYGDAADEYQ